MIFIYRNLFLSQIKIFLQTTIEKKSKVKENNISKQNPKLSIGTLQLDQNSLPWIQVNQVQNNNNNNNNNKITI
jgi:chloramphenicol O-acetyltransferase